MPSIFWGASLSKTALMWSTDSAGEILGHTRELLFYGFTIGWWGFGFVRTRKVPYVSKQVAA